MRAGELKSRVGATLEIESGSNDPMAIFLTIVLIEMLLAREGAIGLVFLLEFVRQMGLGAILGVAGGFGLLWLINRLPMSQGFYPLAAIAGGMVLFGFTGLLGGSGFLAVYLAGLVLGNRPLESSRNIKRFPRRHCVAVADRHVPDAGGAGDAFGTAAGRGGCIAARYGDDPGRASRGGGPVSAAVPVPLARAGVHRLGGPARCGPDHPRAVSAARGAGAGAILLPPGVLRGADLAAGAGLDDHLEKRQFYGDFMLRGDAQVAAVAAQYDLPLPEDMAGLTLEDFLAVKLRSQPVAGDRVRLGKLEFVVRTVADGRVTQVGLRIPTHLDDTP
jgi:hypothetical protein